VEVRLPDPLQKRSRRPGNPKAAVCQIHAAFEEAPKYPLLSTSYVLIYVLLFIAFSMHLSAPSGVLSRTSYELIHLHDQGSLELDLVVILCCYNRNGQSIRRRRHRRRG
jgi:hypothetical protein